MKRSAGTGIAPTAQAIAGLIQWLWSFIRVWIAAWSRHSERAAALPRRWNRRKLRVAEPMIRHLPECAQVMMLLQASYGLRFANRKRPAHPKPAGSLSFYTGTYRSSYMGRSGSWHAEDGSTS